MYLGNSAKRREKLRVIGEIQDFSQSLKFSLSCVSGKQIYIYTMGRGKENRKIGQREAVPEGMDHSAAFAN